MPYRYAAVLALLLAASSVAAAQPDLTLTRAISEDPSGAPGDRPSLEYTVANIGNADAGESSTCFYFSTDPTLSSDDVLSECENLGDLDAGDTNDEGEQITVPSGLTPGAYFIIFSLDDSDVVAESDETNNTAAVPFTVTGTTASEGDANGAATVLLPASPNPVTGTTRLRYELSASSQARLTVQDALGREVAVLADGSAAVGPHEALLDTQGFAAGVYVVRLTSEGSVVTRTITVVR